MTAYSSRGENRIALTIVGVVAVGLMALGWHVNWVPHSEEVLDNTGGWPGTGETVSSISCAQRYLRDGSKYWYLQNLRSPSDTIHPPLIYTHNVNGGAFVYYGFALVGIRHIALPTLFNILIFSAGLYYCYLASRRLTRSFAFSIGFLGLMATEYYFNLVFGLNALRSWHWLCLYGGAYHLTASMDALSARPRRHVAAFFFMTFCAFLVGYDFYIIHFTFCSLILIGFRIGVATPRSAMKTGLFILVVYAFPFVLRQAQVVGALGVDVWARDFYYSAVVKTSFLSRVASLPDLAEIDRWYSEHNLARPPASPETSPRVILATFDQCFTQRWIPRIGWTPIVLALTAALGATVWQLSRRLRTLWRTSPPPDGSSAPEGESLAPPAMLVLVIALAEILGMYFFAPLSIYIYIKHAFPLVISSFLSAFAFVLYLLSRAYVQLGRGPASRVRTVLRGAAVAAIVVLLAERAYQQFANVKRDPLFAYGSWEVSRERVTDFQWGTSIRTPTSAPKAPERVRAKSEGRDVVLLTWEDVAEASEYRVECKTGESGEYHLVGVCGPGATGLLHTGLKKGQRYFWRVQACNAFGRSEFSEEAWATSGAAWWKVWFSILAACVVAMAAAIAFGGTFRILKGPPPQDSPKSPESGPCIS